MEKRKNRPLNKEVIKKEIEPLGWVEEEESSEDKAFEKKALEMINHIKKNKALLDEVKEKMKDGENLKEALERYVKEKIAQHEKTEKGVKKRYNGLPDEF